MFGHNPDSNTLLNKVIDEALKSFIPGITNSNKLLQKKIQLRPGSRSYPDDNFICDANSIPDSNLVASCGPQFADMINFFKDTALHSQRPISQVVVICDSNYVSASHLVSEMEYDCYDYFLTEREVKLDNNMSFQIKHLDNKLAGEHKDSPLNMGVLEAELTICHEDEEKKLKVNFFEVKDGLAIQLNNDYQKQLIWDLANYSKTQPLLIHCRQGIGRTGSFILMLEILKHYDQVFASNDPMQIAKEIHHILKRMRQVRPASVIAPEQFATSIRHAYEVHEFAIKQGYIKIPIQESKRYRAEESEQTPVQSRKLK